MSSLRNLPLHMLLLAGLAAPAPAAEPAADAKSAPKAAAPAEALQAYAGVSVLPLTSGFRTKETTLELPEGVGVVVGLVDPEGPAAGKLQEKDILTRLDDQVLVNADQFRSLIRARKPGQTLKLVRVRGDEIETVEVPLIGRPAGRALATSGSGHIQGAPQGVRIMVNGQEIDPSQMIGGGTVNFGSGATPGGQVIIVGPGAKGLPEEVRRQLEEMRQRGMPVPSLEADEEDAAVAPSPSGSSRRAITFSRSFTLGGSGPVSSSGSMFTDEQGTVHVRQEGDKKFATVKSADGQVLFDGEITTEEQRAALADTVRARIEQADTPPLAIPGLRLGTPGRAPAAGSVPKSAENAPADAPKSEAPTKKARKSDPREGA